MNPDMQQASGNFSVWLVFTLTSLLPLTVQTPVLQNDETVPSTIPLIITFTKFLVPVTVQSMSNLSNLTPPLWMNMKWLSLHSHWAVQRLGNLSQSIDGIWWNGDSDSGSIILVLFLLVTEHLVLHIMSTKASVSSSFTQSFHKKSAF